MFDRAKLYELIGDRRVSASEVAEQMGLSERELVLQVCELPDAPAILDRLITGL